MAGKREIVADIHKAMGGRITKADIAEMLVHANSSIVSRTDAGEKIVIRGFGTYEKIYRKPKRVMDPQSGDMIQMPGYRKLVLSKRGIAR